MVFQNDSIVANSLIGFCIRGTFKLEENELINQLKDVLNRDCLLYSSENNALEATESQFVMYLDDESYVIKTTMYNYFEALYIMPKLFKFLKNLSSYEGSHLYIKIGFNKDYIDLSQLNLFKFILEFNEKYIFSKIIEKNEKGDLKKLTDIKPINLDFCQQDVRKQVESIRFLSPDENCYGFDFSNLNLGTVCFKYLEDINYYSHSEDILKILNHTIITLYNATTVQEFDKKEMEEVDKLNKEFSDIATAFGCYELFAQKFEDVKLTVDLSNDKSVIDVLFSSIKDRLFNIVVYNKIKKAQINYDSDLSRLQIKDAELKEISGLDNIDIVETNIKDSRLLNCDLYDCKIEDGYLFKCNMFGYGNCKKSKLNNCFVSKNIELHDCTVFGKVGKMGGEMKGGVLKNTSVIVNSADINDDVKKINVNEI